MYAATFETAPENNPLVTTPPGLYLPVALSQISPCPAVGAVLKLSIIKDVKLTLLEFTEAMLPSELDTGLISFGLILVVIYRCLLFFY